MTDTSLRDRLARLAGEAPDFDGKARVLNPDDAIAAIFDEIDNSLLPSELRFDNGHARLCLHASGRMLNQVADYHGAVPAPDGVIGADIDPENTVQIAAIAGVIENFSRDCSKLTCASSSLDNFDDTSPNRVSIKALRDALVAEEPKDDQPPFDRFLSGAEPRFTAFLVLEAGTDSASGGDKMTLSMIRVALKTQLVAFETSRKSLTDSAQDFALNLFSGVLDRDESLGVAKFADKFVLFSIASEDVFDVVNLFDAATRA